MSLSDHGERVMTQSTESVNQLARSNSTPISVFYEISTCVNWIRENKFERVALQFPDPLLCDAAQVVQAIKEQSENLQQEEQTTIQLFILGDTTFASCCVDEIAAQHVNASAIIHFGTACLHRFVARVVLVDQFVESLVPMCFTYLVPVMHLMLQSVDKSYNHSTIASFPVHHSTLTK